MSGNMNDIGLGAGYDSVMGYYVPFVNPDAINPTDVISYSLYSNGKPDQYRVFGMRVFRTTSCFVWGVVAGDGFVTKIAKKRLGQITLYTDEHFPNQIGKICSTCGQCDSATV